MTAPTETRSFQAEVQQILHLVIHSLYSHKEIFLRELISNASDACDKLRFEALARPGIQGEDAELRIEIEYDEQARSLTVRDNGIGMSREEVVDNIGTIARSGTRRFLESLTGDQRADAQLIGQFGVGFYSAFIVADRVVLETRRADLPAADGVRWSSDGSGEYTLESLELPQRGTTVILHLKPDEDEFLKSWRLRSLIAKYSDHIGFPIRMREDKDGEPGGDFETVNHASALWTRPKAELKDEDYQSFYHHIAHDSGDALAWAHNRVEGTQSYTSLLYVPSKAPLDALWSGREERKGLKLYIRRVFIMDASEQLLPAYLRFVRGVVDSDDLPLNVSREILQDNRLVSQMRGGCVKRVLDLLERMAVEDADKYLSFWDEFGNVLKEGLAEDFAHRERLLKLLRCASTRSGEKRQDVSLDAYIERMPEGQEAIYYITADSFAAAAHSPHLEALRARGVEVLLMYDRVDEWVSGYLSQYREKPFRNVAKGDLGTLPGEAAPVESGSAEGVIARLKVLLGERVKDVRASQRLTDSPACLVLDEHDMALHMQRMLKAAGHDIPVGKPTLEVNPGHALLKRLEGESDEARAGDIALVLLEQAQLAEGGQLDDPASFVRRVNTLLSA
ncbi:MAG TPA: molecular chaperone HtpG [Xanthomonadaceae bacterium]|nr:molecular chaperone HtpG [Xanthomonadaceae bacterium]